MRAELTLEPAPSAAPLARRWVAQELARRARSELTRSATLGVSELVTNAVLHVRSNIVVRLVDDGRRIRIEVYDESSRAPDGILPRVITAEERPSSLGRGLLIVDSISHAWGVSYEHLGKCVWFQPAPESEAEDGSAPAFEPTEPIPQIEGIPGADFPASAAGSLVTVTIVDLPIHLFLRYRARFHDLRREMTLIALGHGGGKTIAHRLVYLAQRIEAFRGRSLESSLQITAALRAGSDRTTIIFEIPRFLAPDILELRNLLNESDEFCHDEELLTLAPGPQEKAFRGWYLDEMASQAIGRPGIPWTGAFVVSDQDPRA